MLRIAMITSLLLASSPPAHAQRAGTQTDAPVDPNCTVPDTEPSSTTEPPSFADAVVVSASRTEQRLVDAPAAVSVVTSAAIEHSPAANIGDLLRTVPGMNVVQLSARDVNLTSRGATGTLATSQLVLVDGRTIYLDFFGMVMWDLVPTSLDEIERIEVIRGPASAVWGANAMSGVVNVITRTPRALAAQGGNTLTIGIGAFERSAGPVARPQGGLFSVSGTRARALNDRWSYKVTAGYRAQDALPRPTGVLPNAFRTPYPEYLNTGTSQPRFDARLDHETADDRRTSVAGGIAATAGVIHSGLGPFDISRGSHMSYISVRHQRGNRRIALFANLLSGTASNLLSREASGQPLPLAFGTTTFDVEASDARTVGARQLFRYGGNARHSRFDVSLAPQGAGRTEGGVYLQDEIFLNRYLRWIVGGRLDALSSIGNPVFSPRTTLLLKPVTTQTVRVSVNRAFRAPSLINNYLDATMLGQAQMDTTLQRSDGPDVLVRATGNPALLPETRTTYELGYTGTVGRGAMLSAALYWNDTGHVIAFTPRAGDALPVAFSYRNLGSVHDRGLELGIESAVGHAVRVFANASYQADPVARGFDVRQINAPPNRRFNAGLDASRSRYVGTFSVSYTDRAFWQDVLGQRFAGTTPAYTLLNASLAARWRNDRVLTRLKVTNLANHEIQQHVFGDVIRRQITAEVRVRLE